MFDLILQNNGTKQVKAIGGLSNASDNNLYYLFDNFEMPEDLQYGEYSYFLIRNDRDDVEYEFRDVVLDSILHTDDGDVILRDLRPEIGLLKYIDESSTTATPTFRDTERDYYYRKK